MQDFENIDSNVPTLDDSERWEMNMIESFRENDTIVDESADKDDEISDTPLPGSEMSNIEVLHTLDKLNSKR
ncbi:hypothetical protein ACF0H5_018354 [Mactra antiquata]